MTDLSAQNPEKVKELEGLFMEWKAGLPNGNH
jgi:hypothetical protein